MELMESLYNSNPGSIEETKIYIDYKQKRLIIELKTIQNQ